MHSVHPVHLYTQCAQYTHLALPVSSTSWLEEQKGLCDPAEGEVTWYKDTYINATSANKRAAFYCLRLSWNGVQCHQLCDPTDAVGGPEEQMETLEGRNTGVVRHQVELHPLTRIALATSP